MERWRADVRGDSGVEQVVRMVRLQGRMWAGGGSEEEEVQEGERRSKSYKSRKGSEYELSGEEERT